MILVQYSRRHQLIQNPNHPSLYLQKRLIYNKFPLDRLLVVIRLSVYIPPLAARTWGTDRRRHQLMETPSWLVVIVCTKR